MKKLKMPLLISFMLFLSLGVIAQGTESMSASDRATKLTDWMTKNLNLTTDQIPKVSDINAKYAGMNEQLKSSTDTKDQKMATMKNNEAAKDAELKGILTDSQYQTYETKKAEMKKEMKQKMKSKEG
jgi:hypothetical protein